MSNTKLSQRFWLINCNLLQKCILETQSAFLIGKHATNNIIIVKEVVHHMSQVQRKKKICTIKLDICKSYDTLSWNFLQNCLMNMGFNRDVITQLMNCVTAVQFKL